MKYSPSRPIYRLTYKSLHIDWSLLGLVLLLISVGLLILYSASNENIHMLFRQSLRLFFAVSIMLVLAAIPPHKYKAWAPWIYGASFVLILAVMVMGKMGKGAQRWLDLGLLRFQPSELMKLALPMMVAWYLDKKSIPIRLKTVAIAFALIFIPSLIIAKQPDLGTAIMVVSAGLAAVFVAGLSHRIIIFFIVTSALAMPILWQFMHDYQKLRILTLINPERDPLGASYHIIQSKIAIGSGGISGKGWLEGSQSHLNFLPEHATDFIFAVSGEEFGLVGNGLLILLMLLIALKGLSIAKQAQTHFSRLLAAGLTMSFFFSAFVNMGMVMGILPVVGIPLPLVSYGGTAMLTFLASFGILMSISTHRILFTESSNWRIR